MRDLVVQRFHLPPSRISLPNVRDNLIVVHLQGPVYVEEELGRRRQRRWSERNQISITPAGAAVTRVLKGHPDVLLIHLSDNLIKEVALEVWDVDPAKVSLLQCLAEPDEDISLLGRALQGEVSALAEGAGLMAESLSRAMALNLLRRHSTLGTPKPLVPVEMGSGRFDRVVYHMRQHLDEQLSLGELSKLSGVSPSQIAKSFRSSTGQSAS